VERALDGHEYLVGDRFTVADLVCAGVLGFAKRFDLVEGAPNVNAFLERMDSRPARQRANAVS
jgi:glutathione S-transferase